MPWRREGATNLEPQSERCFESTTFEGFPNIPIGQASHVYLCL